MIGRIKTLFKNYSWEFHLWSMGIAIDTDIEEVKSQLPPFVIVDWQKPVKFGDGLLYQVTWIKGHKMKQKKYLGFIDGGYGGCVSGLIA
jgi:hypothetical protein